MLEKSAIPENAVWLSPFCVEGGVGAKLFEWFDFQKMRTFSGILLNIEILVLLKFFWKNESLLIFSS